MLRVRLVLSTLRRIATGARPDAYAFDVASAAWGTTALHHGRVRVSTMQETPQEYIQRMLGYLAEQDPLAIQARTPQQLERLIQGVSASRLHQRPAPGKWSIAEIIAHLADSEIVTSWRIRAILTAPGTVLQAFDQDAWFTVSHYDRRDPRQSIELLRVLREVNLELFKTLTPEQWHQHGVHSERGVESVEHIVRLYAGHDLNHMRQVERILSAFSHSG